MQNTPDLYLGHWSLLPDLSIYAVGEAPVQGGYSIVEVDAGVLKLSVSWRMRGDATDRSAHFTAPAHGALMPLPTSPGAPDAFTLTRVDARTLESATMRGDEVVAFARRLASEDGTMMSVVQENVTPTGERVRNFQVYRRR